jgi:hypothetical protein
MFQMTKFYLAFMCFSLLTFLACKNIDQVLIGEIQNRNAELEALKGSYNDFFIAVGKFAEKTHSASDLVKADSGYVQLLDLVETMTGKGNNRVNEINAAQAELTKVLADYNSGVKKTDDVRKDFQRIGLTLKQLTENRDYMEGKLRAGQAKFDSLAANVIAAPIAAKKK